MGGDFGQESSNLWHASLIRPTLVKNSGKSFNRIYPPQDRAALKEADPLPISAKSAMPSFTMSAAALAGACCPTTSPLGLLFMTTSASGAIAGYWIDFTVCYARMSAWPMAGRPLPAPASSTAKA
jgi:hypothetical protein